MRKLRRVFAPLALLAVLALSAGVASAVSPPPPTASTGAASGVTATAATLNGTVNPQGSSTTYQFQYSTSATYPTYGVFVTPPASAGSGTTPVAVHQTLNGLAPNTTYHYRILATNPHGTTTGLDATFTTGSAIVNSKVEILAPTTFVSPHGVVGVGTGCFGGATTCHGTLSLSQGTKVYTSRGFNIPPESGGFVHVVLTSGEMTSLFAHTTQPAMLASITTSTGQHVSRVVHLVRFH